jgi:7-cyano-7-deazaguanine synthase
MDRASAMNFVRHRRGDGNNLRAVVVLSGGMDSTALAYLIRDQGFAITAVSFDYGQRHVKELEYARETARRLMLDHRIIDMKSYGTNLHGSALTDRNVAVPYGHYAAESMKATVVPNRNMVMLACAIGIAVADGAAIVATGVHAGDHAIYPDCRPQFIDEMSYVARVANEGFIDTEFRVEAPFVDKTKADIVRIGDYLGVMWESTWSCYEGGIVHCGKCGTCVERQEAFQLAGVEDPTTYLAATLDSVTSSVTDATDA